MTRKSRYPKTPIRVAAGSADHVPAVGDEVRAHDGTVGRVNQLLRTEASRPRYMIVATGGLWRRYPVLACGLITGIEREVVIVRGSKRELQRQPEALPVVV